MKPLHKLTVALAYILICFGTYGWFLGNPFILDDELQILENTHIQSLENLPSFFTSSTMGSGGGQQMTGIYYKPLMSSFFSLMWNFFGDQPAGFRWPLLILHALSAFFIFLFSLRFFKAPFQKEWSFILGLFFLLHPINTEVILYLADAQDILYMFFGLLSLVLLSRLEKNWNLGLSLILLFSASLLSKETGVLFLGIATAYAFLFERKKWPVVFGASILVFITYMSLRISIGMVETRSPQLLFHNADYLSRISMLPLILYHYLEIFFFPWRLSVSSDFLLPELNLENFWAPLAVCLFALAGLIQIGRFNFRQNREKEFSFYAFVLLLWFLLHTHVLVPLDGIYADRWLYLVSWAGLSLCLMTLQHWLIQKNILQMKLIKFLALLLAMAMIGRDFARGQDWSDPLQFYQREAQLHPQDAAMNNNVGAILFRKGQVKDAMPYFDKATKINPPWGVAWNNLAACYERERDDVNAEKYYLHAISIQDYSLAYENYAKLLYRKHRTKDLRQFLDSKALLKFPYNQLLLNIKKETINW